MLAVTHYLATKPAGLVTVWLVVAVILAAVGAILAWTVGKLWWPSLIAGALICLFLAFLT